MLTTNPPEPYLTHDLPGIGGSLRQRPEDFLVDEIPLYQPAGEGEHLYLYIEKQQAATTDVARRLAKAFRVPLNDVGYAGLKDKHAITRQHFSVRTTDAGLEPDTALEHFSHYPRANVLWSDRHGNKLRRGHLAGNRFVIRVRDVSPTAVVRAKPILDRLAAQGAANYVGRQRFGYRGDNHAIGRHLLLGEHRAMLDRMLGQPREIDREALRAGRAAYDRGDYAAALEHWPRHLRHDRQALDALRQGRSAKEAVRAIDRSQREFLVAALQSAIFNRVLGRRITEGTFDRLLPGDLAIKHANGAVFRVDEPTAELENGPEGRIARLEISPSGPMWGVDMIQAEHHPGTIEREALAAFELSEPDLAGREGETAALGGRRPLRVPVRDPDLSGGVDEHGPFVRVAFELPVGAFATTVLSELMKTDGG